MPMRAMRTMIRRLLPVLISLLVGTSVPAQAASYTNFGQGCGFAPIMLQARASNLPRLGSTCWVYYGSAAWFRYRTLASGLLVNGLSSSAWRGTPLPIAIPYMDPWYPGSPACNLLVAAELVIPTFQGAVLPFVIPNDSRLVGVTLYQQWLMWVEEITPIGSLYYFLASDGGAMRIGL